MRARMACIVTKFSVELREVNLKNKPRAMLLASAKGTVPVLIMPNGRVIDESADIVSELLTSANIDCQDNHQLVDSLHSMFIPALRCYKYPERHPNTNAKDVQQSLFAFLQQLESSLENRSTIFPWTYTDIMIAPFVRQCYKVNIDTFNEWSFHNVQQWLHEIIQHNAFIKHMIKHPAWDESTPPAIL